MQRRVIRVMAGVGYRHGVRGVFTELGIFTLPCLYILNCILLAKRNGDHVLHGDIHDYETRQRGQICTGYLRLQSSRYSANYYSKKFYNKMPLSYRSLSLKQLKDKTKTWLLKLKRQYYDYQEFLDDTVPDCNVGS